jgi:sulfide:quinone oxidoreductase
MSSDHKHYQVLIVGGGTAGITVAARLRRRNKRLSIAIVEPSTKHYYQPLWTLVGAGVFPKEQSERDEAAFIPPDVDWIRDSVATFEPAENRAILSSGAVVRYDQLVVALGIQIDWHKIAGLEESLGRGGVCSNYAYRYVDYTWQCVREFRGGTALFTMPNTAVKCGGAPQKIMYLADDHFRKSGVRDKSKVVFATAQGSLFAVEKYRKTLEAVAKRKAIEPRFKHNLIEVRGAKNEAVFEHLATKETVVVPYDMLHVTPPMSAPDVIKRSPLAGDAGWVEVDKFTLRHPRFPNVFALGDCAGLPTSKTGAAIRKQAPVVVENLLAIIAGNPSTAHYDGYTSCPVVTGYGRLVLAEFDYEGKPSETFPFDQSKERLSMYLMKAYALPRLYWGAMLRGRF